MFKQKSPFMFLVLMLVALCATVTPAATEGGPGSAYSLLDHVPSLVQPTLTPPVFLMVQDVSGFTYEIINTDDNPDVSGQLVSGANGTFEVNYPNGSCDGALTSRLSLTFFDAATGATLAVTHGSGTNYTVPSGLAGSICRVWLGIYCDGVLIDISVWYVSVI